MFPTFISFTSKHPRYVAVVGFFIFILGVVLFIGHYMSTHQLVVAPSAQISDVRKEEEVSFEEKMKILESLKSSEEDAVPTEEKMKILEDLASDAPSDISTEEKMKILESLKN
jgi:uncharacterized protein YlxW (UPF0749 family)